MCTYRAGKSGKKTADGIAKDALKRKEVGVSVARGEGEFKSFIKKNITQRMARNLDYGH